MQKHPDVPSARYFQDEPHSAFNKTSSFDVWATAVAIHNVLSPITMVDTPLSHVNFDSCDYDPSPVQELRSAKRTVHMVADEIAMYQILNRLSRHIPVQLWAIGDVPTEEMSFLEANLSETARNIRRKGSLKSPMPEKHTEFSRPVPWLKFNNLLFVERCPETRVRVIVAEVG